MTWTVWWEVRLVPLQFRRMQEKPSQETAKQKKTSLLPYVSHVAGWKRFLHVCFSLILTADYMDKNAPAHAYSTGNANCINAKCFAFSLIQVKPSRHLRQYINNMRVKCIYWPVEWTGKGVLPCNSKIFVTLESSLQMPTRHLLL